MSLKSFGDALNVAVVGAGGGIGSAMVQRLQNDAAVATIHAFSRTRPASSSAKTQWSVMDTLDEDSVAHGAELAASAAPLNLVLVTTGILHDGDDLQPEKSWRGLDAAALQKVLAVNTIGPALVAKHFLPRLVKNGKSVFAALSARVGSIGDNRLGGWLAYRSSKAALNMMIKTLSIELARRNKLACCVALHPGTVNTPLSAPFQANVPDGKLFTADYSAERLLAVIDNLTAADSGGFFAWDGQAIPY